MNVEALISELSEKFIYNGALEIRHIFLFVPLVLPLMVGGLLVLLSKYNYGRFISVITLCICLACEFILFHYSLNNGIIAVSVGSWLPPFGIVLVADSLGLLFSFVTHIILLAAALYGYGDFNERVRNFSYYPLLMLCSSGLSGIYLTGDIFNMYVWFEVVLCSSFGLLVLGQQLSQIKAALYFGFVNILSTALFLLSIGMLYSITGTLNMADLMKTVVTVEKEKLLIAITILFMLAFLIKSSILPLHMWLVNSYPFTRPVVSGLFAGIMTKVGIFAIVRILVLVLPVDLSLSMNILFYWSLISLLASGILVLGCDNLKKTISYLIIAGTGVSFLSLSLNTLEGTKGSLIYALQSMPVLFGLFICVGLIERMNGDISYSKSGGILSHARLFSLLSFGILMAAAGIPPFVSFWSKLVILKTLADGGQLLAIFVLLISSFCVLLAILRTWQLVYWRPLIRDQNGDVFYNLQSYESERVIFGITVIVIICLFVLLGGVFFDKFYELVSYVVGHAMDKEEYIAAVFS